QLLSRLDKYCILCYNEEIYPPLSQDKESSDSRTKGKDNDKYCNKHLFDGGRAASTDDGRGRGRVLGKSSRNYGFAGRLACWRPLAGGLRGLGRLDRLRLSGLGRFASSQHVRHLLVSCTLARGCHGRR